MAAAATAAGATLATAKGAVTNNVSSNASKPGRGKGRARAALQQLAGPNSKKYVFVWFCLVTDQGQHWPNRAC